MNREHLKTLLIAKKLRPNAYSLYGGLPNEAYCISEENGFWRVYYSERRVAGSIMEFDIEEDACDYFYNWIISANNTTLKV